MLLCMIVIVEALSRTNVIEKPSFRGLMMKPRIGFAINMTLLPSLSDVRLLKTSMMNRSGNGHCRMIKLIIMNMS